MILIYYSQLSLRFFCHSSPIKLEMFRNDTTLEQRARMGIRKEHAPRALFSELEDGMIKRLQEEVGNKWTYITERINESSECEWDPVQVRTRFIQLEIEEADGHKKKRRVNWTPDEDAQLISLCKKWLKRQTSMYGMYAIL